jgi:acyl-CoA thioesterase II
LTIPELGQVRSPFEAMMALEAHGPDTYVGSGPSYPWGGLYGGQVVAQALRAADLTVKPGYLPHSLHAYFLRVGDAEEPVRFEVERLRDGRSLVARQVEARQSTGVILNMSASFQAEGTPTMDVQVARPPGVGTPAEAVDVSWGPVFELRFVPGDTAARASSDHQVDRDQLSDDMRASRLDARRLGGYLDRTEGLEKACSWFKVLEDLAEGQAVHAAALAYASDSSPAWVVAALHAQRCAPVGAWRPVSLDHAIWFHRPFRADDWLLLETSCASVHSSRGLAQGRVFTRDGTLVATVAQEVLLRRPSAAAT